MGSSYRTSVRLGPFRVNTSRSWAGDPVGGGGSRTDQDAPGWRDGTFLNADLDHETLNDTIVRGLHIGVDEAKSDGGRSQ